MSRDEQIIHATRDYIARFDPTGSRVEPLYDCEVQTILATLSPPPPPAAETVTGAPAPTVEPRSPETAP